VNINIQKALKFHKDGKLKNAEILYRKILKADPKQSVFCRIMFELQLFKIKIKTIFIYNNLYNFGICF
tara:strand:+ start:185 stop:388 length:204 start_codon:yes stop_codon:yes gene_type:complete